MDEVDKDKDKDKKKKNAQPDFVAEVPLTAGKSVVDLTAEVDGDLTVKELLALLEKEPKDKDSQKPVLKFEVKDKEKIKPYIDVKIPKLIDKVALGSFNHGVAETSVSSQGVNIKTQSEAQNIIEGILQRHIDILEARGIEKKKIIVHSCTPKTKEMIEKFCEKHKVAVEFEDKPKATPGPQSNSAPGASIRFGGG